MGTAPYFVYNGMSSSNFHVYIKFDGVHVPILSKTKDRLVEIPTRTGAYDFGSFLSALEIRLDCVVLGANTTLINQYISDLAYWLDPVQGNKPLIVPEYSGYWLAHYSGTSDFKELFNYGEFTLPFVAPYPYRYGA